MKIILITGDHPRHLYFADKFTEEILGMGIDLLWVIEKREAFDARAFCRQRKG